MPDRDRILHDVTRPVRAGMPVWPGDPPCRVAWASRIERGDGANVAEISLSAHTGTHADGAFHVLDGGARIGAAPLGAFLGPAVVVDATDVERLDAEWAEGVLRSRPERVLVRTGAWVSEDVFPEGFAALDGPAARRIADAGVRLFGTDAPSVDALDAEDLPAHRALAEAGVAIVENLRLDGVSPGEYRLVALPLRLEEADASPLRAVLLAR